MNYTEQHTYHIPAITLTRLVRICEGSPPCNDNALWNLGENIKIQVTWMNILWICLKDWIYKIVSAVPFHTWSDNKWNTGWDDYVKLQSRIFGCICVCMYVCVNCAALTGILYIDGLAQDCGNTSALAMELLHSCAKPSIWYTRSIMAHGWRFVLFYCG